MSSEEKASHPRRSARRAKPRSATRQMIWLGAIGLFALTIYNARNASEDYGPLWRVFAGIAACLYLWWLAAMLFDLVFVWHRYLRHAVAMKFLRKEVQRADLSPKGDASFEPDPTRTSKDSGSDDDFLSGGGSPAKKPQGPTNAPGVGAISRATQENREQPLGEA